MNSPVVNRRRTPRAEIVRALLLAAVPLLFIAGVAAFQLIVNVPDARIARAHTLRSFKTIRAADAIDQAIQDAERGQRGFLITGREAYLKPFTRARERLPQLMIELQRAAADSPEQQPRVLRLQSDITTKMNELAFAVATMRQQGYQAAKAIVNTNIGLTAMSGVLADLRAIEDSAQDRFNARLARAEASDERVTATFVVGSLVSAIALLAGAFLLAAAYRRAAKSERLTRATLDSVREGVAAFDADGRLQVWNSPFAVMLGVGEAEIRRGATLNEMAARASLLDDLEVGGSAADRPILVERQGARGASVEVFHNPTADGGSVTTLLDVSGRKQAEEALRQAQKLEALGQMTGGIAHDFNNLLTIIVGSLELLRRSVGGAGKAIERIDMIGVAAERAARLTEQLLAFARRQPLQPEPVDLGQLMQEILPLIRRAVGESITVECVAAGGLWSTTVDAAQFQSAVLNLAINGRDAMPESGKLTIEVANAALDDAYAARHAEVEPGQYALFAITDTGKGMDAATVARALDPFFTTKPPGEGTGLGLPQVYGFVKQSGGHLKIYSEVGEGTTVKLYLPRGFGEPNHQPARVPALAVTGTETVLVVDDDEIVRATVASMLEELGYGVLLAANGAEGLAIIETDATIDLLFTDVVMAGPVSGRRLAERAAELRPTLKVLFTSGYTENAIVHNGRLDPGVELLSKPYGRERLAAKLRRVLDSPARQPDRAARR
ncbi:MAG TPA: CHASE3 domain-containing protein [Stellaceae bacterium]|jgi:signal transduction histidine kinase/ActR/RegA family two-component response regulator